MKSPVQKCPSCGAIETDPEIRFCAKDGTALASLDNPGESLIGQTVAGRYEIRARLGEGGMGTVYRARQLGIDREVAVKIIRAELAQDPALQARFTREARSASRVSSIRVVTLHDYGQTVGGLMYMAMELLDGESVAERLEREGALSPREAVRIATEVARALSAAHELDVVHRDLKPDNVFVTRKEDLVKVLDFGIAKIVGEGQPAEESALTAVGTIVGTPLYMSPEAAAARGEVGPSADLYSLGVMLFEMLTGRPPFEESEPVLLLGMHLRARPPLLRERVPGLAIPDALEGLVDRLLAKDPAHRFQSAEALVEALERLPELSERALATVPRRVVPKTLPLAEPPPAVMPADPRSASAAAERTPADGAAEPVRRSRAGWIVAALSVVALIGAGAYAATTAPSDDPSTLAAPPAAEDPPPLAPEAAPVRLRLATDPAGATLTIDGVEQMNPLDVDWPAGRALDVVARLEGYEDARLEVRTDRDRDETLRLAPVVAAPPPTRPREPTAPEPPSAEEEEEQRAPPRPSLREDPLAPEAPRERTF